VLPLFFTKNNCNFSCGEKFCKKVVIFYNKFLQQKTLQLFLFKQIVKKIYKNQKSKLNA